MKALLSFVVIVMHFCCCSIAFSASFEDTKRAAEQGDAVAQNELGRMYDRGTGVEKDYKKAKELYEKAAEQGLADAQFNLGKIYAFKKGVPQDFVTARQWWEKAAAQGYVKAMTFLGMLDSEGMGAPQDYVKARQWWEKAAAQGSADAMCFLGMLYGLPHARGGVSPMQVMADFPASSSPRPWGCFLLFQKGE